MASMKFAKEALETKLRKYASHCQYLENENASIIDALSSIEGCHVQDGDISGAVISLCDKYSSLEEECEALMSAERRASSHLSELDQLRASVARLESTASESESIIERLTHSESELTRKLNDAKDKISSLRTERDSLMQERHSVADDESKQSRKVKFLEQENLQLLLDLKNAKKKITSLGRELDALAMKVDEDDTLDLGGGFAVVSNAASRGGPRSAASSPPAHSTPPSPKDKENSLENASGDSLPTADKSRGSESARKSVFSRPKSHSKQRRNTRTPRRTLGLGEAGPANDDDTGECKQS